MRWGSRRFEDDDPSQSLAGEVEHFLHGHYLEEVFSSQQDVPAWVWLSALAHSDDADLAIAEEWMGNHAGERPEFDTWGRVLQLLAHKIRAATLTVCSLDELQRDVLVPLELTVMAVPVGPATLFRIVSASLAEIETRARIDRT